MRVHRKRIDGVAVTAYNDSGAEWVVQAGDMTEQRYPTSRWAMGDAMALAAQIARASKWGALPGQTSQG